MRLLVWLMGGKYTSQLTNINTFLICRQTSSSNSGSNGEATKPNNTNGSSSGENISETNGSAGSSNMSMKLQKAKKWNVNIVNGVWLSELYLGNTYALNRPIADRYTALDVQNHFYYDPLLTREFADQWAKLISLPVEVIRQAKMNASPLKQANRTLQHFAVPRFMRPLSPTNTTASSNSSSSYEREAKIPRM